MSAFGFFEVVGFRDGSNVLGENMRLSQWSCGFLHGFRTARGLVLGFYVHDGVLIHFYVDEVRMALRDVRDICKSVPKGNC